MKLIKVIATGLLIALIATFSIIPAFAIPIAEVDPSMIKTHEEFIDEGWEYSEEYDTYYINQWFNPFASLFASSTPHYPNWDPKNLPWYSFPDYVKEILNTPLSTFEVDYADFYQPFMMINYNGDHCAVYVGYNLCALFSVSGNLFHVAASPYYESYKNSVCYMARYDSNYELIEDWQKCEPVELGNYGRMVKFSDYTMPTDRNNDIYYYGGSGITLQRSDYLSFALSISDEGTQYDYAIVASNNPYGYTGGRPFVPNEVLFSAYFKYFEPPTAEEEDRGFLSGQFEKLKNYILYFGPEEPEHVNPFEDVLTGLNESFTVYSEDFNRFSNTLDDTLNNVVVYIENGSGILTSIFDGVPILLYFFIFFIAFAICRKVVGR